ncbi:hypothetical protein NG791_09040 [Laspinema sp. D1]|uniref:hypothetical protein n=1 Tax=Laspinema palackyanum TaxID=3231601 RepID=UPI003473C078|nr:hypothetical protein [Laspinema sp. D2b]
MGIGENLGKGAGSDGDRAGESRNPKAEPRSQAIAQSIPTPITPDNPMILPPDPRHYPDPHRQFQASNAVVYIEVPYSA